MKTNHFCTLISLLVVGGMAISLLGCDSDLSGINFSPNSVNDGNVRTYIGQQAVLVGLQSAVGDWYSADRSRLLSIWTRQMCAPTGLGRPQPAAWNTYTIDRSISSPDDYNWLNSYHVVKLANDIIDNAATAGVPTAYANLYVGIACFYKALALGENAAMYGSIPIDISPLQPLFVTQTAAYAEVQRLLDQAIASFQAGVPTAAEARDLNFSGDIAPNNGARWIAACYTMKARYLMHTLNYAAAVTAANSGISAAANGVYSVYTTTTGEYAPWGHWVNTEAGNPIRANKYYMDLLRGKGSTDSTATDSRRTAYFTIVTGSGATQIVGHDIYGDLGGTGDELTPGRAAGLLKYGPYNARFPLISYQENLLIRAEATARTSGVTAGALADLNAIRTGAGLTAKVAGDFATTAAFITEVLKQKYLQLQLEGQDYHDMRRVNQTDGTPLRRTGIPLRWLYPESETTTNANVPADPARNELW